MKVDRRATLQRTGPSAGPTTAESARPRAQQSWNCQSQSRFPKPVYTRALLRPGTGALRFGCRTHRPLWGMTLVEMLVALGLSGMVLGGVMTMFTVSLKNFTGMSNYASLTSQSRQSMDSMSKDIRQATQVISFTNTPAAKSLTLSNAFTGIKEVYSWDSNSCNLVCERTGQTTHTNLTGCDSWDFSFFQRNPTNNWTFVSTTNLGLCKLINMTWKCSRSLIGAKLNTEDLVTAEIVLRNKP